jgi:hypothetical protein
MRTLPAALLILISATGILQTTQGTWRGERIARGDTTIVRTLSGSVWRDTMELVPELVIGKLDGDSAFVFDDLIAIGVDSAGRIYALDRRADVRVFSPTGALVRRFGRRGTGPGEFSTPNAMSVTRDGRVIVRENRRMMVFNTQGVMQNTWSMAGGFSTNAQFFVTTDGRVLNPTFRDRLVWYKVDGTALDTLRNPQRGDPPPVLRVATPGSDGGASYSFPFARGTIWTLTGTGMLIAGYNERYTFDVGLAGGKTMRIERQTPQEPIAAAEADRIRDAMTAELRKMDPNWRWNGPEIPRTKPFYDAIHSGLDASIWVLRTAASREERVPPGPSGADRGTVWIAPRVFDVFDVQGQYLGAVKLPQQFPYMPAPVVSTKNVYAVVEHADGYPQIVRYGLRSSGPR